MGDRPAAERACKDPNPIIYGRKANVNLAVLGAKPRNNPNVPQGESTAINMRKLSCLSSIVIFNCQTVQNLVHVKDLFAI